jgi:KUP system potassium uptake protein
VASVAPAISGCMSAPPDAPSLPPAADASADAGTAHRDGGLVPLALGALGVVYGDIGTSPLYALKECFAHAGVEPTAADVLGLLSLVFWALTLVVVVKYLTFVMRADNRGEGGILALLALLRRKDTRGGLLVMAGLFGAALLYGDGVITPAISVLSAVEGLEVATPVFEAFVVPLTVLILAALFLVQRRGTSGVGAVFGPATLVWFVAIGLIGLRGIVAHPAVLAGLSPLYALGFFAAHGGQGFLVLGAVVLCITGGEALYADMGHFGRRPIRLAWYVVVFPALLLNYFGQGATALDRCGADPGGAACAAVLANPFYAIVPDAFLYPMVVIATVATVVASQALISGAFSLTQQAVQLGFAPRVQIRHTSAVTEGQIYVPVVNQLLMVACIALVLVAQRSSRLAAAYGIAVTGTMAITSILFYEVARGHWHWPRWKAGGLVALFLLVDLGFFGANLAKLFSGGWFPLVAALGVFTVMSTWKAGGRWRAGEAERMRMRFTDFLETLKASRVPRVPGTAVFMTQDPEGTPPALLHHLKHNQSLHEQVVILTILGTTEPEVPQDRRVEVRQLGRGFWRVVARYGFMEQPWVPEVMRLAAQNGLATIRGRTSYYLGRETFVPTGRSNLARWRARLFVFLARNARSPTEFFGIPPNDVVELGAQLQI